MSLNIHIIFYNNFPVGTIGNITKYKFNTMYGYKLRPEYISNKSFSLAILRRMRTPAAR